MWNLVLCPVTVYHSPNPNVRCVAELSDVLPLVFPHFDCFIIAGDFDFHIDDNTKSAATDFTQILPCFDLEQPVHKTRHVSGQKIDLITSHGLKVTARSDKYVTVSDHYMVFFTLNTVSDFRKGR